MEEKYPSCAHLKRKVSDIYITEERLLEDSQAVNALPLFEKHLSDLIFKKNHSLRKNELLRCRWKCYVDQHKTFVVSPMELPKDDMHFKNCKVLYDPTLVANLCKRKHMTVGPGYDLYGEMPVPNDMHVRQTVSTSFMKNLEGQATNKSPEGPPRHKRRKMNLHVHS